MERYILRANGMKALVIHSDMNYFEMKEYIRNNSKRIHPDSTDTIFRWGTIEFVNPKVMFVKDFSNFMPALIGVK